MSSTTARTPAPMYSGWRRAGPVRARGASSVEFALVSIAFFTLLIGIMEWGRVLFTWNSAAQATTMGARVAAVCNIGSNAPLLWARSLVPSIGAQNLQVSYLPQGCTRETCQRVMVSVSGLQVQTVIPFLATTLTVPPFTTAMPRESLQSSSDAGDANPVCSGPPA